VLQDKSPAGDLHRLHDVLLYQQDGQALGIEFSDEAEHLLN